MPDKKRMLVVLSVAALAIGLAGCQQGDRRDGGSAGSSAWTVGWSKIDTGLDPVEVLDLVGEPQDITVSKLRTVWHYSEDADGPRITFDTRSMRVERWQPPTR